MKLFRTIRAALFLMAFAMPVHAAEQAPKYQDVITALSEARSAYEINLPKWKSTMTADMHVTDPNYEPQGWRTVPNNGFMWKDQGVRWFRTSYKIPETIGGRSTKGAKVLVNIAMSPPGSIYVNGNFGGYFRHEGGDAILTSNANPGEEYVIVLRVDNQRDIGLFRNAYISFTSMDDSGRRANEYIDKVRAVEALLTLTPDPEKWKSLLDQSAALVDLKARVTDESAFVKSLDEAGKLLLPFREVAKKYTIYLIGYSHIDLAWLWDKHEGEDVWLNTSNTVLNLMDEYPEFIFNAGQAHGYAWMEHDYPHTFDGIKKRIAENRWEAVGGAWVEHDGNVPSGEAYVRQYLYGKRYFQSRFGKDVRIGWTPDSFGYNLGLPQILRRSGISGFLTQKINWNDTTKFPYNIFWWEGPDGSRVLTYFPVGSYCEDNNSRNMLTQLKTVLDHHNVPENLMIFGVGDHGGAVTRTHLNRAFSLRDNDIFPNIRFTTAEDYFDHLAQLAKQQQFPVWKDELYLEFHRGTYTTQSDTKRNNRIGEILQEEGEKFASVASTLFSLPYPSSRILDGWHTILFNQFHDILPGSSINSVYRDADRDYAIQQQTLGSVIAESLATIESHIDTTGNGTPLVIHNPLSFPRDSVMEIPWTYSLPENPIILDDRGNPVPSQFQIVNPPDKNLVFVARNIPAGGYAVYRITNAPKGAKPATGIAAPSPNVIENDYFRLTFDQTSGAITSIIDKKSRREIIAPGKSANYLQLFTDRPAQYDAWELAFGPEIPLTTKSAPAIIENGPVRSTFRFTTGTAKSTFTQYVSLYSGLPIIEGRIDADWHEDHVVTKLAFDLNLQSETAWYDIPYAAIERRTVSLTDADRAKYEVSAIKWIDYTDPAAAFGVSLLNNGKYGFDIKDNIMRMTVLRAPTEPDPVADRGKHTFKYALFPHKSDWRDAGTHQQAYAFNYPAIYRISENHAGTLPPAKSFFGATPANIVLTALKKAEDDDGAIIRLFESTGKDSIATITLPAPVASAVEVNLIEQKPDWQPAAIKISGNTLTIPVGHFEIKTIKVSYK